MTRARIAIFAAAATLALQGGPLAAQQGPWGPDERAARGNYEPDWQGRSAAAATGKVEVARFRADGASTLRSGTIAVVAMPDSAAGFGSRQDSTFQAAVESALIGAGYTAAAATGSAHVAEVRIVRSELLPAEGKRKPVSGEMSVGVSNRGSMLGLGLYIDATKPKKALLSTLLETRIRDRASGAVLWEGRASIATREGDSRWSEDAVAARLAGALFEGFPARTGEESLSR